VPSDAVRHDREIIAMNLPQTGGCLCGKIRYEITEAPQLVYTCHCVDCQRLTSSAFSMAIVVTDMAFRIAGIEPRAIQLTADSGGVVTRWVCPECGSWVCGASSSDDGLRRVRAGTLDDRTWLGTLLIGVDIFPRMCRNPVAQAYRRAVPTDALSLQAWFHPCPGIWRGERPSEPIDPLRRRTNQVSRAILRQLLNR
jgi:hypothetical protein